MFFSAIFLNVKLEVRKKRRINRDIIERNRTKNEVENRFEKMIIPMHKKFVETTKKHADLIIKKDYSFKSIASRIEVLINEVY